MPDTEHNATYWLAGGDIALPHITAAAMRYSSEEHRLTDFLIFLFRGAMLLAVAPGLAPREEFPLTDSEISDLLDHPPARRHEYDIGLHRQLVYELVTTRFVDNFLSYVTELLELVFHSRPETLRSNEQERLDYILQFESIDTLRRSLAEKRVERLAFMGMRELNDYLKDRLGFVLLEGQNLERAVRLVEVRNIIVHNRAVVSKLSAKRIPALEPFVGKRLQFTDKEMWDNRLFLRHSALDIDVRAAKKFTLPVTELPAHPGSDAPVAEKSAPPAT